MNLAKVRCNEMALDGLSLSDLKVMVDEIKDTEDSLASITGSMLAWEFRKESKRSNGLKEMARKVFGFETYDEYNEYLHSSRDDHGVKGIKNAYYRRLSSLMNA